MRDRPLAEPRTGQAVDAGEGDTSRWRRIDRLFTEAAALEAAERDDWLERACADDPGLRHEVEELLSAHEQASGFLERAVVDEAHHFATLPPGTRVGAYEVVEELGRGGMGAVYRAVRADDSYHKQVAIKVLASPVGSAEVVHRFLRERQILARFEHPNIARLLDAATTPDGCPCIVMEYVEGVPIDRFCEREKLGVGARIELFETVCRAVQAAHQSLIVHRDLKPGNILVDSAGVPKLLDFGIAKLLEEEPRSSLDAAGDDALNDAGEPLRTLVPAMTPAYASPEQVRGEPITTASDVYSLGVLLFRLLTGEPPYRLDGRRPAEVERVVCGEEPSRPSQRVLRATGDRRRARVLEGDLDTLVLAALDKDPRQRYGSAQELADDLRRYREGLPLQARPPTWGYRFGKLVRRHRHEAVAALSMVVLLLVATAVTGWQAHRAQRERLAAEGQRALAEAERERAEEVSVFLEELFQHSDPHRIDGEPVSARGLLDRGAERLTARRWEQPRVRARLLDTIGQSYRGLGHYDEAAVYLEQALELRRQVHDGDHAEVADSLDALAGLRVLQAEHDDARTLFRQSLEMRRRLLGDDHPQVAESLNNLGRTLHAAGDLEAAEPLLRQALDLKRRSPSPDVPAIANGLNNLAGLHTALGNHGAAAPLFHEALELRRQHFGDSHPSVAEGLNNLGLVHYRLGDFATSEEALRQALSLRLGRFGDDHPLVARSLGNLAAVLLVRRDFEAAEPMLRQALTIKEQRLGDDHPDLVPTLNSLAQALEAGDRRQAAESVYRRSITLQRAAAPAGPQRLATAVLALGRLLAEEGRGAEARPLLEEGRTLRARLPADDPRRIEADRLLAELL